MAMPKWDFPNGCLVIFILLLQETNNSNLFDEQMLKKYISTKHNSKKRRMFLWSLYYCKKRRIPIYLIKTNKGSVKCHNQHEESWLGWIVMKQVNCTTFRLSGLCFQKKIVLAHFQSLFERINLDAFWEKWRQNTWRRMCERSFCKAKRQSLELFCKKRCS